MPNTLVGLFLDPAQARRASTQLGGLGVPPVQIEVLDAYVSSFEERIDGAGIPGSDAAIYKEGLRRGGALVLAAVEPDLSDRAAVLMDDYGAEDIDALAQTWILDGGTAEVPNVEEPARDELIEAQPSAESAPVEEESGPELSEHDPPAEAALPPAEQLPDRAEVLGPSEEGDTEFELPGGLRLRSVMVESPVEKEIPMLAEHVTVERRPANREATAADFQAFEQGMVDLVELAEELVISKKARVIEEVVITKKVRETTETVRENLKHTELRTSLSATWELPGGKQAKSV